jgi:hypothetical protein
MHIHIVYMGTMARDSVWNACMEIVWSKGVILSLNCGNIFNEQKDGQDLTQLGITWIQNLLCPNFLCLLGGRAV